MDLLSAARQRLVEYARDGSKRVFVRTPAGAAPEWVLVAEVVDGIVRLHPRVGQGCATAVALQSVHGFYVCSPVLTLLHAEGIDPSDWGSLPPGIVAQIKSSAAGEGTGSGAHFVEPVEPRPELGRIIGELRASYEQRQQRMNPASLESLVGRRPDWLTPSDGLWAFFEKQKLLLTEGHIVWGGLVQANNLLFEPGDADCPALLVHSPDDYFDTRPHELALIGRTFFSFKNTAPSDPELQAVARLVTDEMDRSMGFELPQVFSSRPVRSATFMVFRKHVPNGVLSNGVFPILTHPSTNAVMIVPCEFWPIELVELWKAGEDTSPSSAMQAALDLAAAIRSPDGVKVTPEAAYEAGLAIHEPGDLAAMKLCLVLYGHAGQQGHPGALHQLAFFHERGQAGLQPDLAKAVELYTRSAQLGDLDSQMKLAEIYERGEGGVKRSPEQARQWLEMAARQRAGWEAQYKLGRRSSPEPSMRELGITIHDEQGRDFTDEWDRERDHRGQRSRAAQARPWWKFWGSS